MVAVVADAVVQAEGTDIGRTFIKVALGATTDLWILNALSMATELSGGFRPESDTSSGMVFFNSSLC